MTAVGYPDAWTEFCLIGITLKGDTEQLWSTMTEKIDFDFGDKDIEGVPLVSGGRVVKRIPMTDESVTMTIYPVSADYDGSATTATGAAQWFHSLVVGGTGEDTTEPNTAVNVNRRQLFQLVFVWASTLPATASGQTAVDASAYRITIKNAYMTKYKLKFDDYIMSADVTFKWPPFTQAAVGNKTEEDTTGGTQLAAVTAYT